MTVREHFHQDLGELKKLIHELAEDTKRALSDAIDALYSRDVDRAQEIIDHDVKLDKKELNINEQAILLIAKQQPFAKDLRRLIIALKISSDLERMADYAVNIAKSTIRLGKDHPLEVHPQIRKMADVALDMVNLAMKAFEHEDISLAKKLAEMDDEVDDMYSSLIREMLEETATNPRMIQHIMQMAFGARYIERFADHITNIGENVFYLVKGETYDLNE
ncbi:phosphate transport system protein [Melghiribacillus thermohalophilus]|uniref:Phosphate-specific transport system accessory protein PhoU n=1 Tax=Melghiribacillus thermohalophilus TaxID=1324956 RepID=A0A4R3NDH0_9BACI|nr:phosphate signaling complex protein PhoU [Melghiribacillus thermohalophilus]TCT26976.1 phosphate transport system protein [Melghiribacillus thermohalophilus]